jgi:hypothetical protein
MNGTPHAPVLHCNTLYSAAQCAPRIHVMTMLSHAIPVCVH